MGDRGRRRKERLVELNAKGEVGEKGKGGRKGEGKVETRLQRRGAGGRRGEWGERGCILLRSGVAGEREEDSAHMISKEEKRGKRREQGKEKRGEGCLHIGC